MSASIEKLRWTRYSVRLLPLKSCVLSGKALDCFPRLGAQSEVMILPLVANRVQIWQRSRVCIRVIDCGGYHLGT